MLLERMCLYKNHIYLRSRGPNIRRGMGWKSWACNNSAKFLLLPCIWVSFHHLFLGACFQNSSHTVSNKHLHIDYEKICSLRKHCFPTLLNFLEANSHKCMHLRLSKNNHPAFGQSTRLGLNLALHCRLLIAQSGWILLGSQSTFPCSLTSLI